MNGDLAEDSEALTRFLVRSYLNEKGGTSFLDEQILEPQPNDLQRLKSLVGIGTKGMFQSILNHCFLSFQCL
jgi:hypothetical protein